MEVTSNWTRVNTSKEYECDNKLETGHTMFWETDRSRSTFEIFCKQDGYFEWKDWPTCLTGKSTCSNRTTHSLDDTHLLCMYLTTHYFIPDITCSPEPPAVPSDPEYSLASDDGTVTINSLVYPAHPVEDRTVDLVLNSSTSLADIPRNYMANLT